MPPVVAAGAAIAGAVGTAATAAVGALSAVGLANGLMIAGTGLSLIGKATGSKTLSNIGLGFSAAGGVTGLATGFGSRAAEAATVSGNTAKTTKLLGVDNIDETLAATTKGTKTLDQLKTFKPTGAMTQSTDAFMDSASNIGYSPLLQNSPTETPNFLQRAGDTLRKYDTTANVLMGMGNAYMSTRGTQAQEDMFDKRLDFEREQIARQQNNFGAPTQQYQVPTVQRTPGTVRPLLRRN